MGMERNFRNSHKEYIKYCRVSEIQDDNHQSYNCSNGSDHPSSSNFGTLARVKTLLPRIFCEDHEFVNLPGYLSLN